MNQASRVRDAPLECSLARLALRAPDTPRAGGARAYTYTKSKPATVQRREGVAGRGRGLYLLPCFTPICTASTQSSVHAIVSSGSAVCFALGSLENPVLEDPRSVDRGFAPSPGDTRRALTLGDKVF